MTSKKKDSRPIREKYRVYFAAGITAWIIFMFFHPIGISGDAMSPTLEEGMIVVVSKDAFKRNPPELFSIVNFPRDFTDEGEEGTNRVRRVVGIPGDTIEIRNGTLYRDGEAVEEPYAVGTMEDNYGPVTLKAGEIFVLGDNRAESIDSRHVGPLQMSALRGTCSRVIWPLSEWTGLK